MSKKMAYDMDPADQRRALAYAESQFGISFPGTVMFSRPEWKKNFDMACDAQPSLVTVTSGGIPAYLTFFMDPDLLHVLTSPNQGAEIFGEKQKGSWTDSTIIFPVVERTYEVSSYGDFNNNGRSGINTNFPERQPYLYQTVTEYGDLEIERVGLAKIGFVAEQKEAAIDGLNKFSNLTYFRGVAGLQNYGALNDPSLYPAIGPAPKAAGGTAWTQNGVIVATANEIFADIQSLVRQVIAQGGGNIDVRSPFTLAMSPTTENALTATNSFNVNVAALIKNNYPNLKIKTAVQYGALSSQNPQGNAVGEVVQLYCERVQGQESGYCSFNTKLRAGPVVRDLSSYKQKLMQGTNGFILRQPFAMSTMVGV